MADKLIVDDGDHAGYRICWSLDDGDDLGAYLGDERDITKLDMTNEHHVATKAALDSGPSGTDWKGFYWESKAHAKRALIAAKAAIKLMRSSIPWPEWAKIALAAGWKPPKGWEPPVEAS